MAIGSADGTTNGPQATKDRSIAIGSGNGTTGVAGAIASGVDSIAIGTGAVAGSDRSVAIGAGATTTASNQIVLGTGIDTVVTPGNATVGGTLGVTGATTLAGLTAGASTLDSAAITNNATVGGTFAVTGATTLSTVTTTGLATLNSAAITNNATVGGALNVTGITTLTGALNADGGVTTSSFDSMTTDGTGQSYIANAGGTVVMGVQNGTAVTALIIEQTGPAQLWGDLLVKQVEGTDNGGNLIVDKNATVGGTLAVTGATTLATLTAGASTLASAAITGNATVGGTLGVTGATTLNGATTVNNSLAVNGATTLVGTANINTTGSAATTIGNSAAPVALTGSTASMTGGSTNLTLNNNGASFSSAGAPVKVTGIANGTSDFDAVNVRQFSNAVASVAAAANIPGVDTNQKVSMGLGLGSYMNSPALAFGGSYRFSSNGVIRGSLSTGLSNGGGQVVFGLGAGWSW